jgi:hypothetical protein
MELRSRTRQQLRRVAISAALGALLVPATAGAATTTKSPTVTKVTPKAANVGDTLTITGKHFRRGKGKNTVLLKRDGGKAMFVKAGVSTAKKLTLAIPKNLEKFMVVKNGQAAATRFRVRILTTKLGKKFTAVSKSPLIGPEKPPPPAAGLDPNADTDGDGLNNGFETGVTKTDPTKADTDGDGVPDGYEYASAIDLNNDDYSHPRLSVPYPGKRGYSNPLDPSDANTDFDGDSLTLSEEYTLWKYTVANGASPSLTALTYSDGLKYSIYTHNGNGRRIPALPAANYDKHNQFLAAIAFTGYATVTYPDDASVAYDLLDFDRAGGRTAAEDQYYDLDHDGFLSDDERDEDGDGLTNYDETHGFATSGYWVGRYGRETPFHITYAGTSLVDPDSDGDGIVDGADDQDHDDYPNVVELSRNRISGRWNLPDDDQAHTIGTPAYGRVNPFNPCLPNINSRTCPSYIPFTGAWAPFDGPNDPNYLVLN